MQIIFGATFDVVAIPEDMKEEVRACRADIKEVL